MQGWGSNPGLSACSASSPPAVLPPRALPVLFAEVRHGSEGFKAVGAQVGTAWLGKSTWNRAV